MSYPIPSEFMKPKQLESLQMTPHYPDPSQNGSLTPSNSYNSEGSPLDSIYDVIIRLRALQELSDNSWIVPATALCEILGANPSYFSNRSSIVYGSFLLTRTTSKCLRSAGWLVSPNPFLQTEPDLSQIDPFND